MKKFSNSNLLYAKYLALQRKVDKLRSCGISNTEMILKKKVFKFKMTRPNKMKRLKFRFGAKIANIFTALISHAQFNEHLVPLSMYYGYPGRKNNVKLNRLDTCNNSSIFIRKVIWFMQPKLINKFLCSVLNRLTVSTLKIL